MFEELKKNIEQEKKIIADVQSILSGMKSNPSLRTFYLSSLSSLTHQLNLLNKAVPELLKEESPLKKFTEKSEETKKDLTKRTLQKEEPMKKEINKNVVKISYISPSTKEKEFITLNKEDKKAFLEKLKISEENLKKIRQEGGLEKKRKIKISQPLFYTKFSNRFFRETSEKLSPKFNGLSQDLKKGNMNILLASYISLALMSTTLSFIAGMIIFIFLVIMNLSNLIHFWIPFGLAGATMTLFYFYPASVANSVQKRITQELPFATIHMAAISGSDIEPTKIFKIISASKEYPNIAKEIHKITTQIEIYGYDLVTSLKNVASRTSNKKLSELFSGLATNISTGGELKTYLESKAENFLLDYRLERQKYSETAGTFMDIYISILIAGPLVLMMMFIVMNVVGLSLGGLGMEAILLLSVGLIVIVNLIFIAVLNMKQPNV
ncbi:MAG: type II secretion system F family protein [Candidatus Pacearchaeota archaeon]